jgi:hypothetical protein
MVGIKREEGMGWRNEISRILENRFRILSPYRGRESKETFSNPKCAVVRDKSDIRTSDIVIVNDSFENVSMIGTSMEILYAYENEKTIIAFGGNHRGNYWLDYHLTTRVETLEEACNLCLRLYHD